jgi:hypothetical protein
MGSASPHCEERHTSCELLLDIREGPGRRTGFAVSSHSGQATATLASVLAKAAAFNGHDGTLDDGEAVFHHACRMGLEGIVSKRLGSCYRSGRSPDWLKFKNPEAPAVRREAEEDWGR